MNKLIIKTKQKKEAVETCKAFDMAYEFIEQMIPRVILAKYYE